MDKNAFNSKAVRSDLIPKEKHVTNLLKKSKMMSRKSLAVVLKNLPVDSVAKFNDLGDVRPSNNDSLSNDEDLSGFDEMPVDAIVKVESSELFDLNNLRVFDSIGDKIGSHVGQRTLGDQVECDLCKKIISSKPNLLKHLRIVHSNDRPFQCPKCLARFKTRQYLRKHDLAKHLNHKPHVCDKCGKGFNQLFNMKIHRFKHDSIFPFLCEDCGRGFHKLANLKLHKRTHTGEKPYHCECGKSFAMSTTLNVHRERVHGNNPAGFSFPSTTCPSCKVDFDTEVERRNHLCPKLKYYKCDKCPKFYKGARGLFVHKRKFHEKRFDFQCSYANCSKRFVENNVRLQHERSHSDNRPFKCSLCSAAFKAKQALQQHATVHSGEKPHICEVCGMRFSRKANVDLHMRTHTGERPFVCHCGKAYRRAQDYRTHRKGHLVEGDLRKQGTSTSKNIDSPNT